MRIFRPIPLFFAILCSASWSARAQADTHQPSSPKLVWLALGNQPKEDTTTQTPLSLPTTHSLTSSSFVLHHQADAVLLHLKGEHNYVKLQVMSALGQVLQTTTQANLSGGFHELTLLSSSAEPTLYVLRLVINQEVITFSATL